MEFESCRKFNFFQSEIAFKISHIFCPEFSIAVFLMCFGNENYKQFGFIFLLQLADTRRNY